MLVLLTIIAILHGSSIPEALPWHLGLVLLGPEANPRIAQR